MIIAVETIVASSPMKWPDSAKKTPATIKQLNRSASGRETPGVDFDVCAGSPAATVATNLRRAGRSIFRFRFAVCNSFSSRQNTAAP